MDFYIDDILNLLRRYVLNAGYGMQDAKSKLIVPISDIKPDSVNPGADLHAIRLIDSILAALAEAHRVQRDELRQLRSVIPVPNASLATPTKVQAANGFASRSKRAERRMKFDVADAHATTVNVWAKDLDIPVVDVESDDTRSSFGSDSDSDSDTVLTVTEKIFNKISAEGTQPAKKIVIHIDKQQRDSLWDNTLNLSSSMVQLAPRLRSDKMVPMHLYASFAVSNRLGHEQACAQTAKAVSANEEHAGDRAVTEQEVAQSQVSTRKAKQKNSQFIQNIKNKGFARKFNEKYKHIRDRDCLSGLKSYNLISDNGQQPTASEIFAHAAGLHEGSSGKRTKKLLLSSVADVAVRHKVSEMLGIIKRNDRIEQSNVNALVSLLSQPMGAHRSGMFAHNEKTCAKEALLESAHNPSPYRVEIR